MAKARTLKPSRAKWQKNRYYRKRAKNWRSKSGKVYATSTSNRVISYEETNAHPYGFQKIISKRKARQAQKLFGVNGKRRRR